MLLSLTFYVFSGSLVVVITSEAGCSVPMACQAGQLAAWDILCAVGNIEQHPSSFNTVAAPTVSTTNPSRPCREGKITLAENYCRRL